MFKIFGIGTIALCIGMLSLTGCGKSDPKASTPTLELSPTSTETIAGLEATTFTATASNTNNSITWKLEGPGTLDTTSGTTVRYTPPQTLEAQANATLTATAGDLSKAAAITIKAAKPPVPEPTRADYNAFNATLPLWQEFSPKQEDKEGVTGPASAPINVLVGGERMACSSTPYSITQNPETIVTLNPDVDAFWLGSLLQGKHYRNGIGSLAELPVRQRAPITVYVDLLSGAKLTETVENPDAASVQQAVGSIVSRLQRSGEALGGSTSYAYTQAHSMEQSSLKLGVSIKFVSAKVKSSLEVSRRREETTVMVQFVQRLFTVAVVRPQTPADFFSNQFTQEKLEEQQRLGNIGPDNIPVYVAGITYGRILHFNFTSTASYDQIRATLEASKRALDVGGKVNLTAEQQRILQTAKISFVALGGDRSAAESIIRSGNYVDYFSQTAPLTTAVPISFQVRNLADGTTALVSETTNYNVENCAPRFTVVAFRSNPSTQCTTNAQPTFGSARNCSKIDTFTLAPGEYFLENTFRMVYAHQRGSNPHCTHTLGDFFVVDGQRVARSVTVSAFARSNGGGTRGRVECFVEAQFYRPNPAPR